MDSEIMQCPSCGNWRHRSQFSVGRRGCSTCQADGTEWLGGMDRLQVKLRESEMLILKQIIFDLMMEDELPPEFTDTERRILHGRMAGYGDAKIAEGLKLKVNRMTSIEKRAQQKLKRIATELMPDWIAAHN